MSVVQPRFRIRLQDPARLHSLLEFLEATVYATVDVTHDTIGVTAPEAARPPVARDELRMYLRIWERIHPGAEARLID